MQITTACDLVAIQVPGCRNTFSGGGDRSLVRCELLQGKVRHQRVIAVFPTLRAVPFTLHMLSKCSLELGQESFVSNVLSTLV